MKKKVSCSLVSLHNLENLLFSLNDNVKWPAYIIQSSSEKHNVTCHNGVPLLYICRWFLSKTVWVFLGHFRTSSSISIQSQTSFKFLLLKENCPLQLFCLITWISIFFPLVLLRSLNYILFSHLRNLFRMIIIKLQCLKEPGATCLSSQYSKSHLWPCLLRKQKKCLKDISVSVGFPSPPLNL